MHIPATETSVLRALKAYKCEGGMSETAAANWAVANLVAGIAKFNAFLAQPKYRRDHSEAGPKAAWADLKAWARATP